jgi:hypothetical protein
LLGPSLMGIGTLLDHRAFTCRVDFILKEQLSEQIPRESGEWCHHGTWGNPTAPYAIVASTTMWKVSSVTVHGGCQVGTIRAPLGSIVGTSQGSARRSRESASRAVVPVVPSSCERVPVEKLV